MPKPVPANLVVIHPDGTKMPYGARFQAWRRGDDKWDTLFRELGYTDADRQMNLKAEAVAAAGNRLVRMVQKWKDQGGNPAKIPQNTKIQDDDGNWYNLGSVLNGWRQGQHKGATERLLKLGVIFTLESGTDRFVRLAKKWKDEGNNPAKLFPDVKVQDDDGSWYNLGSAAVSWRYSGQYQGATDRLAELGFPLTLESRPDRLVRMATQWKAEGGDPKWAVSADLVVFDSSRGEDYPLGRSLYIWQTREGIHEEATERLIALGFSRQRVEREAPIVRAVKVFKAQGGDPTDIRRDTVVTLDGKDYTLGGRINSWWNAGRHKESTEELVALGVPRKNPRAQGRNDDEIRRLHGEGLSSTEIARRVGMDPSTVIRAFPRMGLTHNPMSATEKIALSKLKNPLVQWARANNAEIVVCPTCGAEKRFSVKFSQKVGKDTVQWAATCHLGGHPGQYMPGAMLTSEQEEEYLAIKARVDKEKREKKKGPKPKAVAAPRSTDTIVCLDCRVEFDKPPRSLPLRCKACR